ncbi:MAG: type I DNA topoisomerase [Rickettsia sp.]|nr:type I DNA topoisomerase [Rickettsia sp.]
MKLVIVESPSKAKTISKYLGKEFKILASYGHVRAIPSKKDSVLPSEDFLIKYETIDKHKKHLEKIIEESTKSEAIFLATDPDREGEAISWHIYEILKTSLNNKIICKRIIFHEITKSAILKALANPKDIDIKLVNAQQARQALDYLVGFSLSPLLWRKLPGCRSAGRVQSVALRLVCSREEDIEAFVSEEYWTIELDMLSKEKYKFTSKLNFANGEKLSKFSIKNQSQAEKIKSQLEKQEFYIYKIDKKRQKRNPPPPLITASLQQEAYKKLHFTSKKTMSIAQKLYEGINIGGNITGLITYMRTDCYNLSEIALKDIRNYISKNIGLKYLPSQANKFKSKKNTQEAHEAIRPTDINQTPHKLENHLTKEQFLLYDLIWKRAIISQMQQALIDITSIDIKTKDGQFISTVSGSTIFFDGFLALYGKDIESTILPNLQQGEEVELIQILPSQHFTEPKPRFNEASLIKELEELGIGRPSTYSTIISVLLDRQYLTYESRKFLPTAIGRILNVFLTLFFKKYVEYDFTADLEKKLDEISIGNIFFKDLLKEFWQNFEKQILSSSSNSIQEVVSYIEQHLNIYIHKYLESKDFDSSIKCPKCIEKKELEIGILHLKLSKYGPFLACSQYPECNFTKQILNNSSERDNFSTDKTDIYLGSETSNDEIFLKKGPYGFYLEKIYKNLEKEIKIEKKNTKTKKNTKKTQKTSTIRITVPKILGDPLKITLKDAIKLLNFPLHISEIEGKEVSLGLGKFGPYIKYGEKFFSIPKSTNFLEISALEAKKIITEKKSKKPKTLKLKS